MPDYKQYAGQRVNLVYNDETGAQQVLEGRCISGNALGVIVKAKGKTTVQMIEAENIISVEAQPEAPKKISVKKMKPIENSGVRAHLALYHGVSLETVNGMTDEQGAEYHNSLDHGQLGHNHLGTSKDEADEGAANPAAAPTE